MTSAAPDVGELDADNERLVRESLPADSAVDVPDERTSIQLAPLEITRQPSLAPCPELADHRGELFPGRGEPILGPLLPFEALDGARLHQLAQPGGQHGARDAWDAALHLAETSAPAEQLAHDEERPSLTEQIQGPRDRAELTVRFHGWTIPRRHLPRGADFVPRPASARS